MTMLTVGHMQAHQQWVGLREREAEEPAVGDLMTLNRRGFLVAVLFWSSIGMSSAHAGRPETNVRKVVTDVIVPLMREHDVPGFAVGVVTPRGREIFTFGLASKDMMTPVTPETLFEVGSISKTFTATLSAYAEARGRLALSDSVTKFLPELKGGALEGVSLLNLATHTSGGMPLQFPDAVKSPTEMMEFYRTWTPSAEPGSSRTYANPSIGLLGLATARAMKADFTELMEGVLYPALGLQNTYLNVPTGKQANYAQGYTKQNVPTRLRSGVLAEEAYGVRASVTDLTMFMEANMGRVKLDADIGKAISATHVEHFRLGPMRQALIWEQYAYPVTLRDLLAGNAAEVAYKPNKVTRITLASAPQGDVWVNKTGSTNGFGAYVAFVPGKALGIVLLANKNYPVETRITAAYEIMTKLAAVGASGE
jgi:beta-lactamase class C